MKTFTLLATGLVTVTLGSENVQAFMAYTSKYGKSYKSTEEFEMRLSLFNEVDADIRAH